MLSPPQLGGKPSGNGADGSMGGEGARSECRREGRWIWVGGCAEPDITCSARRLTLRLVLYCERI